MSLASVTSKELNVVDLDKKRRETHEEVLERLFNEHRTSLRAFIIGRTGYDHEVDDVIQEVFIRLSRLDGLDQRLPPDGKGNIAYLFSVAHNLVIDMERRKAMIRAKLEQYRQDEEGLTPDNPPPEALVLADQELERIKAAIMVMRPAWRKAFILNRFKFKTYREVAKVMNVSVKQVEKYMKSALIKVREAVVDNSVQGDRD